MISISRRDFVVLPICAAAIATAPAVQAQSSSPVRIVVGFPPGGAADMIGRAISEPLRNSLGQTVIVDNKPGAGGRIACEVVKNAPPDGNMLLLTPASAMTLYPHIYKNMRYELTRDFTPVTSVAKLPIAMYVGPAVPAEVQTAEALVRWLKANPKSGSYAIPASGSTPHLAGMIFGRSAKLDWQAIPYQGGAPVVLAVMSGEVAVGFTSIADGIEHVRAGKLRMLATTGSTRNTFLATVSTLAEQGFTDAVVEDRHSVYVAKGTPAATVAKLNSAIRAALQQKEVVDTLNRLALEPTGESPDDFEKMMRNDYERWGVAAKTLNFTME